VSAPTIFVPNQRLVALCLEFEFRQLLHLCRPAIGTPITAVDVLLRNSYDCGLRRTEFGSSAVVLVRLRLGFEQLLSQRGFGNFTNKTVQKVSVTDSIPQFIRDFDHR
jgi:hypothetical protein